MLTAVRAQHPTLDSLRSHIPASDAEIRQALSRKRVVTLDGCLRPLPPSFLAQILPSILSSLPLPPALAHTNGGAKKKDKGKAKDVKPVVDAAVWTEADEQDLVDPLDAVDCGNEEVARQALAWFGGEVEGGRSRWKLDAAKLVKELGVVLLAEGGVRSGSSSPSFMWLCLSIRHAVWAATTRPVRREVESTGRRLCASLRTGAARGVSSLGPLE